MTLSNQRCYYDFRYCWSQTKSNRPWEENGYSSSLTASREAWSKWPTFEIRQIQSLLSRMPRSLLRPGGILEQWKPLLSALSAIEQSTLTACMTVDVETFLCYRPATLVIFVLHALIKVCFRIIIYKGWSDLSNSRMKGKYSQYWSKPPFRVHAV